VSAALRFVVDKESSNSMNVEIIGDREFITSVQEQGGVWVLMAGQSLTLYLRRVAGLFLFGRHQKAQKCSPRT